MTDTREHLAYAPITEALVDFRVDPNSEVSIRSIQDLGQELDGYNVHGPIVQLATEWKVSDDSPSVESSTSNEVGVRLHSEDERYVLQLRTDRFTLSRLAPYERWEHLIQEAQKLWSEYTIRTEPKSVTRVATRYINTLKLPMKPGEQFDEYLKEAPRLAAEIPQSLAGFYQRFIIPHPRSDARANFIVRMDEGFKPDDHVPIILDIDAYQMVSFGPDSEDLWDILESLRVYKNSIFFSSITDKTVELFK